MVNVADVVDEALSSIREGVLNNSPDKIFGVLKILKEGYRECVRNTTQSCENMLRRYLLAKQFEPTSKHVIGYKKIEPHECIVLSLGELDSLEEAQKPAVDALLNTIGDYLQENVLSDHKGEQYYFKKAEKRIGIVV